MVNNLALLVSGTEISGYVENSHQPNQSHTLKPLRLPSNIARVIRFINRISRWGDCIKVNLRGKAVDHVVKWIQLNSTYSTSLRAFR